jgi:multimeric flavodoxin WrbA/putative sterol carrier protein
MRVLAVNGSPRGAAGNTDVLVQAFLSGAREAGAETDTIYLNDKTIHHCLGCFSCWVKTPGVCVHDDDMPDLLPRLREADTFVIASPLYGNMVTGLMKNFMDRTLPLSHPAIEKQGDQYLHPPRYGDGVYRTVLITNAGFPQTHHFEGLKKTLEISTSGPRAELAGMICCAGGPMLTAPGMKSAVQWYLDAAVQAGREVVQRGRIAEETQAILDRPLIEDPGKYADIVNAYWRRSGVEMPEAAAQNAPLPGEPLEPTDGVRTVRDLVSRLPQAFSPEAAGDLRAAIQFDIADEEPGAYHLVIEDGSCSAYQGMHPSPRMTIHAPADVWLKVCSGELDGAAAFMSGRFRVSGDAALLMQFRGLFAGP